MIDEFQWEIAKNIKEILFLSGLIIGLIVGHYAGMVEERVKWDPFGLKAKEKKQ